MTDGRTDGRADGRADLFLTLGACMVIGSLPGQWMLAWSLNACLVIGCLPGRQMLLQRERPAIHLSSAPTPYPDARLCYPLICYVGSLIYLLRFCRWDV